jgi:hypothetical protein
MKYILSLIISGALVVSGFGQTRNVLVGTNSAVVQPTNFWSADASNARSGLGLGTAATNPATAFQPSSTALSNLATGNGGALSNLQATNLVGVIPVSNIPSVTLTNIGGTLAINSGGTGATNAANARINLGSTVVGDAVFTATNAEAARVALSLGTAATSSATSFQPSSANLTNLSTNNGGSLTNIAISGVVGLQSGLDAKLATNGNAAGLTNITAANITGTVALASNISGTAALSTNVTGIVALANGGTGATNAPSARTALGLGTSATNSTTDFQPSSSALTNLALNNGGGLTNLQATNLVGIIPASNIATVTLTNIGGTLSVSQGGTGATNAVAARTNLGLGWSALTNTNASGFRNAIELSDTNSVSFTRVTVDPTASASAFRFGTNFTGLWAGSDDDYRSFSVRAGGSTLLFFETNRVLFTTNIDFSGGSSGIIATTTRTNLGLGATWLTNTAASNFRTAIGLGTLNNVQFAEVIAPSLGVGLGTNSYFSANSESVETALPIEFALNSASGTRTNLGLGATNNAFASLSVGINITNNSTVSNASSAFGKQITIDSTVENSLAVGFGHSMSNFGNQAGGSVLLGGMGTMTNWGAFLFNGVPQGGAAGVSRGNSTFAVNASNGIYLNGPLLFEGVSSLGSGLLSIGSGGAVSKVVTNVSTATPAFVGWDGFGYTAFGAGTARTNLGVPWTGLTNTNAATFQAALFGSNTNPVLVDTGGSVVSPTNFWAVAPISTTVQYQTNVTGTSTNAATNSRNLFLFSLAPSVSGITNTVTLPTNPATTFEGDRATITHLAQTTNAVTAIRQLGAATNLITLNQLDETVLLMYRSGAWRLADNISYIEPIFFSGTNAAANAAASRTNLGLGATNEVAFGGIVLRDGDALKSEAAGDGDLLIGAVNTVFSGAIGFNNTTNAATTRTNLGLGQTNSVTFSALTLSSDLTLGNGDNIVLSTTNGTKIGTATNQLLGFYNQTPIVQPSTTGVTTNGFTQGSGNNIHPNSTFTGGIGTNAYTISDIVAHLKSLGLIAP